MEYESYISKIDKEDLKDYYKKDQDKFVQVGFVQRTKRSINEFISLADLSKIVVDRKAESVIVYGLYGRKLEYICRTLAKQYHVFTMHVDGIGWAEYCFNSRLSMLCKYDAYFWDAIEAFYIEDEMRIKKIKKKIIKYLHKAKSKMLLTLSLSPARLLDIILYDAAKECNIPVVLLEHSLMNNAAAGGMEKHLLLGKKYIDFYWCWNQKNRDIYIQHQLTSEEKSFVLGYPLPPQEKIVKKGGGG